LLRRLTDALDERSIATVLSTQMLPHGEEIIEIAKGSDADQWDRGADRIVPTGTSLPPFVRLGQKRPMHSAPVPNNVRYASNSDRSRHEFELTRCANSRHRASGPLKNQEAVN
jgi:hypothetical protein